MYRLRKGAPGSIIELNPVSKEVNGLRSRIKGMVTSGQDLTQLNFQLKKSLESGVVMDSFNPSIGKVESGRSLGLSPAWSTDPVSGQTSLGSEGQKAGEDIMKVGAMCQPQ